MIVICFFALVYGLYIKTTKKQSNLETNLIDYNLNLEKGHKITDIDLIDNNRILFTIKNNDKVYALIYDINIKSVTKIDTEKMNKDKNNFENNLKKLESIVDKLENGEVDLEESVKLYEEGMNLKKACEEKLKNIESQIKKIKQENNKISKEDFKLNFQN